MTLKNLSVTRKYFFFLKKGYIKKNGSLYLYIYRWDTQQQLYLNLLDGVRYLVVWQPVSKLNTCGNL